MEPNSNEYLPFGVLLLTLLSIRISQPSIQNFITAVVGAAIAWLLSPTKSHWGSVISLGLVAFAFALSPFMYPACRIVYNGIVAANDWVHRWVQHQSPKNQNPAGISATEPTESTGSVSKPSRPTKNPRRIKILYQPEMPKKSTVDVVAVHGLGSSVETTWTHAESQELWLKDFLPHHLPSARIMTYRYNSTWMSNATLNDLHDYGLQLLSALITERSEGEAQNRPLVLIGHSFGGLLIEQALVLAKRSADATNVAEPNMNLINSLAGLIFLGTPHAGSSYLIFGKLYCLFHFWDGASTTLLRYLDPSDMNTHELVDEFSSAFRNVSGINYYERVSNSVFGVPWKPVVDKLSATRNGYRGHPLDTDHFGLNKFESDDDASYLEVKSQIVAMVNAKIGANRLLDQNDNASNEIVENGNGNFITFELSLKLKAILEALSFENIDYRETQIEDKYPQNCSWILDEQSPILPWFKGPEPFFWVSGKAGCGKSTLMKYIYRNDKTKKELSQWADGKDLILAGYFFYERGGEDQKSREGMLRSILHQILKTRRRLISKVFSKFFKHLPPLLEGLTSWENLCDAFKSMLQHIEGSKICLFLDGLDEYRMVDRTDEYTDKQLDMIYDGPTEDAAWGQSTWIVDGYKEVAEFIHQFHNQTNLKLCISSRELPAFEEKFQKFRRLQVHEHTADSIAQYCLERLEDGAPSLLDKVEYVSFITSASQGVFLWVNIVIDILIDGNIKGKYKTELLTSLKGLPRRLGGDDGLYMHMMQTVDRDCMNEAKRLFQLVMAWQRDNSFGNPLDIVILFLAEPGHLDVDSEGQLRARNDEILLKSWEELEPNWKLYERRLKTMCGGLLENTKDVRFMHQTAKEFMSRPYLWTRLFDKYPGFPNDTDIQLALMSGLVRRLKCCGEARFQSNSRELSDEDDSDDDRELKDDTVNHFKMPQAPRRGAQIVEDMFCCARHIQLGHQSESSDYIVDCVGLLDEFDRVYSQIARDWKDALPDSLRRSSVASASWLDIIYKPLAGSVYESLNFSLPLNDMADCAVLHGFFPYVEAKVRGTHAPQSQLQPLLLRAACTSEFELPDYGRRSLASSSLTELLFEEGADPNFPNERFKATGVLGGLTAWTSLLRSGPENSHKDAVREWISVVKLFIERGANPNAIVLGLEDGAETQPDKIAYEALTSTAFPKEFEKDREEILELLSQAKAKLGDTTVQGKQGEASSSSSGTPY